MSDIKQLESQVAELNSKLNILLDAMAKQNKDSDYTLHVWLDEWLKVYKAPNVKPSTLYGYDVCVRVHIKPNLPDIALNLITGIMLQSFLVTMPPSRSRKAVHDVLKESFKTAFELKIIKDNPLLGVKIPTHRQEKGMPLTPDELTAFLRDIQGIEYERYFLFLLYTGCRRSEGLSIKVTDVDFDNLLIRIRGTKTAGSKRTIPMFNKVRYLLNSLEPNEDGFYFRFRADNVTHRFKELCPTHKLHDLRHTFATLCLQAKIPLKVVQKWLGHSKLSTTADIYSHVLDDFHTSEAQILDRYISEKTE